MSPAPNLKAGPVPYERRQHQRFPMNAAAHYVFSGIRGEAVTHDISSGGVFLKTPVILPVGKRLQIFIDWPALLDNHCPLRLVVSGRVLRSDTTGTAVGIIRYDYKLRRRGATPFAA